MILVLHVLSFKSQFSIVRHIIPAAIKHVDAKCLVKSFKVIPVQDFLDPSSVMGYGDVNARKPRCYPRIYLYVLSIIHVTTFIEN